jgi:hypothetical protein
MSPRIHLADHREATMHRTSSWSVRLVAAACVLALLVPVAAAAGS